MQGDLPVPLATFGNDDLCSILYNFLYHVMPGVRVTIFHLGQVTEQETKASL